MPKKQIKQKHPLDKFYTKPEIASICYGYMEPYINKGDFLIEPSAGNGSFFSQLREPKIGMDISPDHPDIIEQNWFDYTVPEGSVVIGNPPFGSRNEMTKKFIQHATCSSKCVAFVLPAVFKKHTLQSVFPEEWELVFQHDLPRNSFSLDGKDYHIPAVFQIWINPAYYESKWRNYRKTATPVLTTVDFVFTNKSDSQHFVFGSAPHRVISPSDVNPNNRGYYFTSELKDIRERFANVDWKSHALSSVNGGASWFTKQQIIDVYSISFHRN